jgi:hypothetical protein
MGWWFWQLCGFLALLIKVPSALKALIWIERPIERGIVEAMNRHTIAEIKKRGIKRK